METTYNLYRLAKSIEVKNLVFLKFRNNKFSNKPLALASLTGTLLALAYPGWPVDLGWLVWIGFIPLFFALAASAGRDFHSGILKNTRMEIPVRNRAGANAASGGKEWNSKQELRNLLRNKLRNSFKLGFAAGFVYFLIIFRWFWSLHPLSTFGVENNFASLGIVILIYLVSSAGMAVSWGLFALIIAKILPPQTASVKHQILKILAVPAVFVLAEYFRSWFFGILWYGDGTLAGPHWTLGNPAYALAGSRLALSLASIAGIYGVIFMVTLVNTLFLKLLQARKLSFLKTLSGNNLSISKSVSLPHILIIAAATATLTLAPKAVPGKPAAANRYVNYAIVQTKFPTKISYTDNELLTYFNEQLAALRQTADNYPETDIVVLPESSNISRFISIFQTTSETKEFFGNLFDKPVLIFDSFSTVGRFGQKLSRVVSLDSKSGALGYHDKQFITPVGEFLPYSLDLILRIVAPGHRSTFKNFREISYGAKDVSTVSFNNNINAAPIVCLGLFSPSLAKITTQEADVVTILTNTSAFRGNGAITGQMLATSRFRAAENRKPVLLAANDGLSYAIDNFGNIQNITQNNDAQLLTGQIGLKRTKTWYNKLGDMPILLASLIVAGTSVLVFRFKAKKLKDYSP